MNPRTLIFLIFLAFCQPSQAQFATEVPVEPKPYIISPPYYDDSIQGGVREVFIIVTEDRYRKLYNDTGFFYAYDRNGFRQSQIRFEKGKRTSVFNYNFAQGHLISWQAEEFNDKSRSGAYYSYQKSKKSGERGYTVHGTDTNFRSSRKYSYNDDNQLVEVNAAYGDSKTRDSYIYEKGKLVEHRIWTQTQQPENYYFVVYRYNELGQLIEKKEKQLLQQKVYELNYRFYEYEDGLLAGERYISSAGKPETAVSYSYNQERQLQEMNIRLDSLYKQVYYTYKNGHIKHITVRTNAWNGLNGEFYIPLSSINSLTPAPFTYEEDYQYDDKGHLVEKLFMLNGEIERIIRYLIVYWK